MSDTFPNLATHIVCDHIQKENLNGPIIAIRKHFVMLCHEASKVHPFFGSCTKQVCNSADWKFVEEKLGD